MIQQQSNSVRGQLAWPYANTKSRQQVTRDIDRMATATRWSERALLIIISGSIYRELSAHSVLSLESALSQLNILMLNSWLEISGNLLGYILVFSLPSLANCQALQAFGLLCTCICLCGWLNEYSFTLDPFKPHQNDLPVTTRLSQKHDHQQSLSI